MSADTVPSPDQLVIPERHVSHLTFNVMPDKPVREDLTVHEYRVGYRYGEAHFDREYHSEMKASPSHLIFLSALSHTQKLLYVVLCHEFGFDYDPRGPERFKMWPTKLNIRIPELISQEAGLVQRLWVRGLRQHDRKTYRAQIETRIGSLAIDASVPTFLLEEPARVRSSGPCAPRSPTPGRPQADPRGSSPSDVGEWL